MPNDFINRINGADLLTMINVNEFGELVDYTPNGLSVVQIPALYQEPTMDASVGLEVEAIGNQPSVIVRAVDITWNIRADDTILIRGNLFKVVDFIDEKLGAIEIFLHRG